MIPFFVLLAFRKRNLNPLNPKNRAAEIIDPSKFFADAKESMAARAVMDPIFLDHCRGFFLARP